VSYREKNRLLSSYHCPVDRRIQDFLGRYFEDLELDRIPTLPFQSFTLDRHGLARELSVPVDSDVFESDIITGMMRQTGNAPTACAGETLQSAMTMAAPSRSPHATTPA
jgi:hypothetical protein